MLEWDVKVLAADWGSQDVRQECLEVEDGVIEVFGNEFDDSFNHLTERYLFADPNCHGFTMRLEASMRNRRERFNWVECTYRPTRQLARPRDGIRSPARRDTAGSVMYHSRIDLAAVRSFVTTLVKVVGRQAKRHRKDMRRWDRRDGASAASTSPQTPPVVPPEVEEIKRGQSGVLARVVICLNM